MLPAADRCRVGSRHACWLSFVWWLDYFIAHRAIPSKIFIDVDIQPELYGHAPYLHRVRPIGI